ncbi:MAG: 50S ribosomal protein L22 [Nitrospirota bacterium]|nr:50S ribosomal protein L22 [Nitrospirota bacterium]MDH5587321.1 50S ribosomal protein L22 [Nitrospirota bacterium]MDH5774308.1 50S ribosomal protein L22 [Nitrospirota bacterium]
MAEVKAILRHVRMAPRKARLIVDMVRGRNAAEALALLRYTPRSAARVVEQLLFSAVANAGHKDLGEPETLKISQAFVDGGAVLKRFQPRAQGRASPIKKRTSHITIVVGPIQ